MEGNKLCFLQHTEPLTKKFKELKQYDLLLMEGHAWEIIHHGLGPQYPVTNQRGEQGYYLCENLTTEEKRLFTITRKQKVKVLACGVKSVECYSP